ncbi:hypothetical protein GCM10009066_15240 [Halarchaeum salinum]|uniref:Uncharacterized protein n=1 Tax=Halarchaeum salinum TaxID=489912 RepID=A0AAV3S843_9EURY
MCKLRHESGAVEAVRQTTSGYHVNLVTHAARGHPETYLYDALEDAFGDQIPTSTSSSAAVAGTSSACTRRNR